MELPAITPMLPLYIERGPLRVLPNAGARLNIELAALLVLPLIRNPSAAFSFNSAAVALSCGGAGAAAGAASRRGAWGDFGPLVRGRRGHRPDLRGRLHFKRPLLRVRHRDVALLRHEAQHVHSYVPRALGEVGDRVGAVEAGHRRVGLAAAGYGDRSPPAAAGPPNRTIPCCSGACQQTHRQQSAGDGTDCVAKFHESLVFGRLFDAVDDQHFHRGPWPIRASVRVVPAGR